MDNRFSVEKEKSGKMMFDTRIVVDRQTGVQYLFASSGYGYGGGVTVMVDKDGKPLLADGFYR